MQTYQFSYKPKKPGIPLYIILLIVLVDSANSQISSYSDQPILDSSRFELEFSSDNYFIIDKVNGTRKYLEKGFLIDPDEEQDETESYVTSFEFSKNITAFYISKELMGLHLSSFQSMEGGSAQAAAGRDIFLVYQPEGSKILNCKIDLGITKSRVRWMGCFAAEMSHFVVSDMNDDGINDLGIIKEELLCKVYFDSIDLVDGILGPRYVQQPVKWYIFQNNCWEGTEKFTGVFRDYVELPLIDLSLSPVDFFGFIRWHSYDPKDWDNPRPVKFYPDYRKKLIAEM